jgi:ribosomal protein S18 acetylase RimI-like enzyme
VFAYHSISNVVFNTKQIILFKNLCYPNFFYSLYALNDMTQESENNQTSLSFRYAKQEDAAEISHLVNSAYRGDSSRAGWTTEADLIEGARTNESEIINLIEAKNSMLFLCIQCNSLDDSEQIVGSVHIEIKGNTGHLGLFVVNPIMQGSGIGKRFMQAAETQASTEWAVTTMTMSVITSRDELIAFYERRGYKRTGELTPFPTSAGDSVPKHQGIQFEKMMKELP